MNAKTKELVGIAAAIAGHYQRCFAYHYNEAKELGVGDKDIGETIALARSIRQAGDDFMDKFAERKTSKNTGSE